MNKGILSVVKSNNIYKYKKLYGYMLIQVKGKDIKHVQVLETNTNLPFENPYYEQRVLQFLPKWADKMGFSTNNSF